MAREKYGKRYISRGREGKFTKNVSVGKSLAADRRTKAKTVVKQGYGDKGDLPTGLSIDLRKSERKRFNWW